MAVGLFRLRAFLFLTLLGGCFVLHSNAEENIEALFKTPEGAQIYSKESSEGKKIEKLLRRSEDTPEESPEETPEDQPKETAEEKPEETPEEKPDETPEEKPEETPEEKPDEKPEEKPEETPAKNDSPDIISQSYPVIPDNHNKSAIEQLLSGANPNIEQLLNGVIPNIQQLPNGVNSTIPSTETPWRWYHPITKPLTSIARWICGWFTDC